MSNSLTADIHDQVIEYCLRAGIDYKAPVLVPSPALLDTARMALIGQAYDKLVHQPSTPAVAESYAAFKKELYDQLVFAIGQGMSFDPWKQKGQPYANSQEMFDDIRQHNTLRYFTESDIPADHPLAALVMPYAGMDMTYNHVFRMMHDYFGHAQYGNQFGPLGEENAWRAHASMFSPAALPALTTETRGQNTWVNFGPYSVHNHLHPEGTIYPPQKAALLPRWCMDGRHDDGIPR
jgi:hypothetical protein